MHECARFSPHPGSRKDLLDSLDATPKLRELMDAALDDSALRLSVAFNRGGHPVPPA